MPIREVRLIFQQPPEDVPGDASENPLEVPKDAEGAAAMLERLRERLKEISDDKGREQMLNELRGKLEKIRNNVKSGTKEAWEKLKVQVEGLREQLTSPEMKEMLEGVQEHITVIQSYVRGRIEALMSSPVAAKAEGMFATVGAGVAGLFSGAKMPEFLKTFWKDTQEFGAWIAKKLEALYYGFVAGLDEKNASGEYKYPSWLRLLFGAQIAQAKKKMRELEGGDALATSVTSGASAERGASSERPAEVSLMEFGFDGDWKVDMPRAIPRGIFSFGPGLERGRSYSVNTRGSPITIVTPEGEYAISELQPAFDPSSPIIEVLLLPRVVGGTFSKETLIIFRDLRTKDSEQFSLQEIEKISDERGKSSGTVTVKVQKTR
jgi:hypothetical protein